jgi:hypothetical protein
MRNIDVLAFTIIRIRMKQKKSQNQVVVFRKLHTKNGKFRIQ